MRLLAVPVVTDIAVTGGKPVLTKHVFTEDACDPFAVLDSRFTIGIAFFGCDEVIIPRSNVCFSCCLHILDPSHMIAGDGLFRM